MVNTSDKIKLPFPLSCIPIYISALLRHPKLMSPIYQLISQDSKNPVSNKSLKTPMGGYFSKPATATTSG